LKIVLDFHEGGSRPGDKSHEAAGIHQTFQQHGNCMAADRASAAGGEPVIGFLSSESSATWAQFVAGFREGLSQTGCVEGRNLALDFDRASGDGPA